VSTAALEDSQVSRRGIATIDSPTTPVAYWLPIAFTPTTATAAWPRLIPAKLTLAGSIPQVVDWHRAAPVAAAPTTMVSVTAQASTRAVPGSVWALLHSAGAAWTREHGCAETLAGELTRPSCAAGKRPAPRRRPPRRTPPRIPPTLEAGSSRTPGGILHFPERPVDTGGAPAVRRSRLPG
jgi:hypothetical protein